MKTGVVTKGIVLGMIILFVGAGFIPSTCGSIKDKAVGTNGTSRGYIQGLIDNASDGGAIVIPSGTYVENIFINKSITLIGEDKNTTIIDGAFSENVIEINADEVTITGFTVQNGNESGILIKSDHVTIHDNILVNNSWMAIGIVGWYSTFSHHYITDNTISHSQQGIFADETKDLQIINNTFTNLEEAIFLGLAQNITIQSNTISLITTTLSSTKNRNIHRISQYFPSSQLLTDSDNYTGIVIIECNKLHITNNVIHSGIALGLLYSSAVNISQNVLLFTNIVLLSAYSHLTITKNNILRKNLAAYIPYLLIVDSTIKFTANYWYRPRLLPKIVIGYRSINSEDERIILKIFVDWRPALRPYNISRIS